jgi:hypothetical protein
MIDDSNFDMWVFGNTRTASAARARIEARLKLQLDEIDRAARLTEAQKKKLELAGRGDIKRFFDRVEEKRKEFESVRTDQQKFSAFFQELRPLQLAMNAGLFGDESIFARTLKKTLDPEQTARYETVVIERRHYRQRAWVGLMLAKLDGQVGLTAEQRTRLNVLLLEETRPPRRSSSYDFQVMMLQLARVPQERLKAFLSDAQWKLLSQQFVYAQGFRQILIQQDLLPDGPAAEVRPLPGNPALSRPGFNGR